MLREYVFIVHEPNGDNSAFKDITTAQQYVKECLINEHNLDLIKNYLMHAEETVCNNYEQRPMSLSEFIDDELVNGDITKYDYTIESLPILTEKDF